MKNFCSKKKAGGLPGHFFKCVVFSFFFCPEFFFEFSNYFAEFLCSFVTFPIREHPSQRIIHFLVLRIFRISFRHFTKYSPDKKVLESKRAASLQGLLYWVFTHHLLSWFTDVPRSYRRVAGCGIDRSVARSAKREARSLRRSVFCRTVSLDVHIPASLP